MASKAQLFISLTHSPSPSKPRTLSISCCLSIKQARNDQTSSGNKIPTGLRVEPASTTMTGIGSGIMLSKMFHNTEVPSPNVAEGHQHRNASLMADVAGSRVITEDELDSTTLGTAISEILGILQLLLGFMICVTIDEDHTNPDY
ncbi:hypothetical protein F3Y22_tig00016885pilonHSYRG00013 [Hibiscus syriacus]|uniref:Uncharacterized protein n=1 Tax=Hibiscus syriacus TaxID=106335 RepID=A0A6A3C1M9_HIBSY|nr:hypothetical protein F3Y22_tig00016885pilonHSYRG00013 [Hibiscus syriacus]